MKIKNKHWIIIRSQPWLIFCVSLKWHSESDDRINITVSHSDTSICTLGRGWEQMIRHNTTPYFVKAFLRNYWQNNTDHYCSKFYFFIFIKNFLIVIILREKLKKVTNQTFCYIRHTFYWSVWITTFFLSQVWYCRYKNSRRLFLGLCLPLTEKSPS